MAYMYANEARMTGSGVAATKAAQAASQTYSYANEARMSSNSSISGYGGYTGSYTGYYNSSYQTGKIPSPDAPRIEDVGNQSLYLCENGLNKDIGEIYGGKYGNGEIKYKDVVYSIYVPDPNYKMGEDGWKTVSQKQINSKIKVDWAKVITGGLEEVNGSPIYAGTYQVSNGYVTDKCGLGVSAAIQLLNSIGQSSESLYINMYIQEKGTQQRAILVAGSSSAQKIYDSVADDNSRFLGLNNQAVSNLMAGQLYEELTGNQVKWYQNFDIRVTVDSAHSGGDIAYLWFQEDTLMGTPIIYDGDKIEVGALKGILGLSFEESVDIPINSTPTEMLDYANLVNTDFR